MKRINTINTDEPPIIKTFVLSSLSWRTQRFVGTQTVSSDWTKFLSPDLRTFGVRMDLDMTGGLLRPWIPRLHRLRTI